MIEYFDLLNEAGQQMMEKLEGLNAELISHKEKVKKERINLQILHGELNKEKETKATKYKCVLPKP